MRNDWLKIEREWLEAVAMIEEQENRDLFILVCVGVALGEHCGVMGFYDKNLNELWRQTRIVKKNENRPGRIELR